METQDRGTDNARTEGPELEVETAALAHGLTHGPAYGLAHGRRAWATYAWWSLALLAAAAATVLVSAYPALAQAGGETIDTCSAGGGVGGEGGQKILGGIRNLALFAAALVGGVAVLGLIASALMIILGSTSKDWQRRGFTGVALAGVGVFVALGAASLYGIISWAICG